MTLAQYIASRPRPFLLSMVVMLSEDDTPQAQGTYVVDVGGYPQIRHTNVEDVVNISTPTDYTTWLSTFLD